VFEEVVMRTRLALVVPIALAALVLVSGGAAAETSVGTWRGQVVSHDSHYDYEGVPCDVSAEACIQIVVSYRLVPVTEQARRALPRVAGGTASLSGTLDSQADDQHAGTLYVERVRPS
jgi:hypothetical protein